MRLYNAGQDKTCRVGSDGDDDDDDDVAMTVIKAFVWQSSSTRQ